MVAMASSRFMLLVTTAMKSSYKSILLLIVNLRSPSGSPSLLSKSQQSTATSFLSRSTPTSYSYSIVTLIGYGSTSKLSVDSFFRRLIISSCYAYYSKVVNSCVFPLYFFCLDIFLNGGEYCATYRSSITLCCSCLTEKFVMATMFLLSRVFIIDDVDVLVFRCFQFWLYL